MMGSAPARTAGPGPIAPGKRAQAIAMARGFVSKESASVPMVSKGHLAQLPPARTSAVAEEHVIKVSVSALRGL